MKEKANNEIDLLLRRLNQRDGATRDEYLGQHLDVDELSSYAQNALPAAARARYTEHLAECSTCRKLVTELSLSLGATAAAAAAVETVSAPSALRKFLASLFSPLVLRYAVPALGLIVVAVIGFVTLRQQDRGRSVAQISESQKTAAPSTAGGLTSPSPPAHFADAPGATVDKVDQPKETAPERGQFSGDTAAPALAAPAVRDEQAAAEAKPTVAAEPPPAAPAKTAEPADQEQKKLDAVAKKQEAVAVATTEADSVATNQSERGMGYQTAPQPAARKAGDNKTKDTRHDATGAVSNARVFSERRAREDESDADTRTVSGRRFRKERGIWTDTAYDSSTATVNVARGSEQFRSLVADEPEIKQIAEQLDGEVIVVWKGRAYRIR